MVSLERVIADLTIAIVVPVFSDTSALRALIENLRGREIQPTEIVVVSGRPDAQVHALCHDHDCLYLESVASRGKQLDQGATQSTADVIWFLHADAEPHIDGLAAISNAIADGAEGGYFRFQFVGDPAWWKRMLERLILWRTRMGGIPYGDQGIFARRDAYRDVGGFAHQPLFEEVTLVKNLRARGHFRELRLPIGVAPRRWERDGWCQRSLKNRSLAIRYLLGVPVERLADHYDGTVVTNRKANQ